VQAATLNADRVGDCQPANQTLQITADNGLNFSGSRRLKNVASADFIAYSLTALPLTLPKPGNNAFLTFTFSGTVVGSAYANAPAGVYSDTVLISVNP
jgi:spore coat protein U-like protein